MAAHSLRGKPKMPLLMAGMQTCGGRRRARVKWFTTPIVLMVAIQKSANDSQRSRSSGVKAPSYRRHPLLVRLQEGRPHGALEHLLVTPLNLMTNSCHKPAAKQCQWCRSGSTLSASTSEPRHHLTHLAVKTPSPSYLPRARILAPTAIVKPEAVL